MRKDNQENEVGRTVDKVAIRTTPSSYGYDLTKKINLQLTSPIFVVIRKRLR